MTECVYLGEYNGIKGGDSYMDNPSNDKIMRVLGIYTKLINGEVVNKSEEARYSVTSEKQQYLISY